MAMEVYVQQIKVKVTEEFKEKVTNYREERNYNISALVDIALSNFFKDPVIKDEKTVDRRTNKKLDKKEETLHVRLSETQHNKLLEFVYYTQKNQYKITISSVIIQALETYMKKNK